jgi:hypothetical protein
MFFNRRRHQRIALHDLLAMNTTRLDELGLNRHDIISAATAVRTTPTDVGVRPDFEMTRSLAFANP